MANQEHLELLKQGVASWNRWREQHSEIQPDLSEAYLHTADLGNANLDAASLRGANLHRADLHGASLIGADLRQVRLHEANLTKVNLIGVNLAGVNMLEADLRGANLRGVSLSGVDLRAASLTGADLHGANLAGARISGTLFAKVDLRETKGLAEVEHSGPSRIELYTVQLPQDGSALHFLREAGVPDEWIDLYRAQMFSPIQYHSCFISYSSHDETLARRLHADLQDHGVRCWFAPEDMKIGDKIRPRIDEAIHLQDKLLLILSNASVASNWVEHEVETALAKERKEQRTVLFPVRVDQAILDQEDHGWPALVRHQRHIGDFTNWTNPQAYQVAFKLLLRDLKKTN